MVSKFFILIFFLAFQQGAEIYKRNCASCHGDEKLGGNASPLIFVDSQIVKKILQEGLMPFMPSFSFSQKELDELINYLQEIPSFEEDKSDHFKKLRIKTAIKIDPEDTTILVQKDAGIYVLKDGDFFDSVSISKIHGGVKFSAGGVLALSKSGELVKYPFGGGEVQKIKLCSWARNLVVSHRENLVYVLCLLPQKLVLLDEKDLKVVDEIEIGKRPISIFSFKQKVLAITRSGEIFDPKEKKIVHKLGVFVKSFCVSPFSDILIIGSDKEIYFYDGEKVVFSYKLTNPSNFHFFSCEFWYNGDFVSAVPLSNTVVFFKLYDWQVLKEISFDKPVLFIRTHPETNYLWVSDGQKIYLINKFTFEKGRGFDGIHAGFSPCGDFAFVSGRDNISVLNPKTFETVKVLPIEKPLGKYNFFEESFQSGLLGWDIYRVKCWGCHHQTKMAFGPPLNLTNRDKLLSQIEHPNLMPGLKLSKREVSALADFLDILKRCSARRDF